LKISKAYALDQKKPNRKIPAAMIAQIAISLFSFPLRKQMQNPIETNATKSNARRVEECSQIVRESIFSEKLKKS
jgi:hypothetical protein